MSLYHVVEILIVAAAVGASAWALAVRLVPRLRRRPAGGNCSSCDSCGACGSSTREQAPAPAQQPIRFHPRDH
jgi:hypothetical protein